MNFSLPQDVLYIINTLSEHNFEAFAVGGCVRDTLLDRVPKDWDITTNAMPQDIINIFEHTVPTGIKHGTISIIINKTPYEVTTYRIDGEYTDNRHPDEVIFTNSITEDLSRRDFTINAIAYNPKEGLSDPFSGEKDLNNKLIKCVGDPSLRFQEDALRMLRAIRFSTQLDFEIEEKTLRAISYNSELIKKISYERVREELCKILLCNDPSVGFQLLNNTGLLSFIIPEFSKCVGFSQRNPHHNKDIFEHTLAVLDNTPKDLNLRLAALFHDIGKPKCFTLDENGIGHFYMHEVESATISNEILKRLRFDNNRIKTVSILIREHLINTDNIKPPAVKRLINRVGVENLDNLFKLQIADIKGHTPPFDFTKVNKLKSMAHEILEKQQAFSTNQLAINGSDLIELGYPKGVIIGRTLGCLLDMVIENPELNTKEKLIKFAKEMVYEKP